MAEPPRKKYPLEHHLDRLDLAGEHPIGDLIQLLFFFLFFAVWVIDSFITKWSLIPTALGWFFVRLMIGVALIVIFGVVEKRGLSMVFNEIRDPPSVIMHGPFRWSRHPIYLGVLLFYLALSVFTFSLLAFGLTFASFWLYRWLALHEEKLMAEKFGVEYQEYLHATPRWFGIQKAKKKNV